MMSARRRRPAERGRAMKLLDVVGRDCPPAPAAEAGKIPWSDPAFSERMLAEHLSQAHDLASRCFERIDRHVAWIHRELLVGRPARVLDLGCGPGLYTSRLAALGHECVGIDYAPAPIAYATDQAGQQDLACTYVLADVLEADYGDGFDLVMMIFGEINVLRRADAEAILAKARAALRPGGLLLLEPHTFEEVERIGRRGRTWYSVASGLFLDRPHVCLQESFWDADAATATDRYYVVDAATGEVTQHAAVVQAYTDEQFRSLLTAAGFGDVRRFRSLTGTEDPDQPMYFALTARKPT